MKIRLPLLACLVLKAYSAFGMQWALGPTCAGGLASVGKSVDATLTFGLEDFSGTRLELEQVSFRPDGERALFRFGAIVLALDWDESNVRAAATLHASSRLVERGSGHWAAFHGNAMVTVWSDSGYLYIAEEKEGAQTQTRMFQLPPDWLAGKVAVSPDVSTMVASSVSVWAGLNGSQPIFPGSPLFIDLKKQTVSHLEPRDENTLLYEGLQYSPDGKLIVGFEVGRLPGYLTFWDGKTGKLLEAKPVSFYLSGLSFSPDGKYLVAGDLYENLLRVWNCENRTLVQKVMVESAHQHVIIGAGGTSHPVFSPNGKHILVVHPRRLKVDDMTVFGFPITVSSLVNRVLAYDFNLLLAGKVEPVADLPIAPGTLGQIAFSPSGSSLLVGLTEFAKVGIY